MSFESAVRAGRLDAVQEALLLGEDVNRRLPSGFTALMIAAGLGAAQVVKLLLPAGADPHLMDPHMGSTALHKAAQSGDVSTIDLLLDHGAFVDQQSPILGNTPLMDAVLHKNERAVCLLLNRGARMMIRNHWQQSALDMALEDGSEEIANLFNARDLADKDRIARSTLIRAIRDGDVAAIRRLITKGADVDQRLPVTGEVEDAYTPLGVAVRSRQMETVGLLLEAGADPGDEIGLMRGTAIHEAAFLGYPEILQALLHTSPGAERAPAVDAQGEYNGQTALHDAVWHGHIEAARVLLEAGADLELRNHAGLTARDIAVRYGFDELASMLAEART